MLTRVITLLYIFAAVKGDQNLDKLGVLYYKELNCTPSYLGGPTPSAYACPRYEIEEGSCKYNGLFYGDGEEIHGTHNCQIGCVCSVINEEARIDCAAVDCGSWAEGDCYNVYNELDDCCPTKIKCPPFEKFHCSFNGKIYKEGEKFYDGCTSCICRKGFSGRIEAPYCDTIKCNTEIWHSKEMSENCAPIYSNWDELCCPMSFLCPDDENIQITKSGKSSGIFELTSIILQITKIGKSSGAKCHFGRYSLHVGDTFQKIQDGNNVSCACLMPPLVACVGSVF